MRIDATALVILVSLVPLAVWSIAREARKQRVARDALRRAAALGLDEPVSLHPVIDANQCVGCGGCVTACPERDVLMLVSGRARLVNASHCVGHGACAAACPQGAIQLVFGTAARGMQIPEVGADYQTNVPGIYIAGELGGMGLIRNAVTQGVLAVANAARALEEEAPGPRNGAPAVVWDAEVAIVGAGPAGLAAALACRERGLRFALLDQDGLGGSVNHYPRRKLVMTSPVELPLVGPMHFREVGKEQLLAFWNDVVRQTGIEVRAPERVTSVQPLPGGFEVGSERGTLRARRVILAIGRRGTPRKLGVPGEESEKVAYRLLEPERWEGQRVLVVGGGNSAVEAAVSLAEAGARTSLSYRGTSFGRVAQANQERLVAVRGRRLQVLFESQVTRIEPEHIWLDTPGGERRLDNDQVFVLVGGDLPSAFLERIGVRMALHHGERPPACAAAADGGAA